MKPFWRVLCRRLRARGILIPLFILRVSDFNHTLYLLDEFFHQVFLELYFNRKVRNVSNGVDFRHEQRLDVYFLRRSTPAIR